MTRHTGVSAMFFVLFFSLLLPSSGGAQDLDFTDLKGTLPSGTTTLSGTVTVTGDLTVPPDGTLIVQAGTTVRVEDYWTSIFVEGILQINGTSTNSVTLTSLGGNSDSPWGGIKFNPGSSGTITQAQFRYGGGELSGIIEIDDASVTVRQSTFRNSDEDGIRVNNIDADARIVLIESCTFADNSSDDIECYDASPTIAACTFSGDGRAVWLGGTSFPHFRGDLTADDGIWLASGSYAHSGTWEYAGIPYILDGDRTVPEGIELTIDPKVIVKGNDYWTSIFVDGSLNIEGTAVDPVIFTSMQDDTIGGDTNKDADADEPSVPEPNNWGGIHYRSGSSGSITHAQFAYGGGEIAGMIEIDDASVTIRQSIFKRSGEDGIRVRNIDGVNRTVLIENCTFADINSSGSDAIECNNASPTITACTFENNNAAVWLVDGTSFPHFNGDLVADDGVWLDDATYDRDGTWEYAGIPYILDGDITVPEGIELTIEPGIVVKGNSHWNSIFVDGSLSAFGKPDSAIVFTSMQDDSILGDTNKDGDESVAEPNSWGGIYVRGAGIARLHYSHLLYGGGESRGMIESIDDGMAILENSLLAHSGEDGLYADNGGKGALRYCSIIDNRDLGVRNETQGTHFDADDNNWWGDPSGPLDSSDADGRVNPDGLGSEVGDYVDYEPWSSVQPALGKIVVPEDPGDPVIPEIVQVSTDRTEYTTDQPIIVSFSGFPGNQEDWISLSPVTLPDNQYSSWWTYTSGQRSGALTFDPLPAGRYEVRAYFDWPDGGYEVHRRYSFLVRGEEPTLDLEPVVTSLIAEPSPTEGADIATLRATISLMAPQASTEVSVAQRYVPAIADKTGRAKAARVMALSLTNQHLAIAVNEEQGYFDINTAGDSHLIYGDGGSSYANVNIDGEIHKYGRDSAGSFISTPAQDGSSVTSSWQVGDIAVTQRVSLVRSAVTGQEDAAWIQYELRNVGAAAHQVGLYLQMDTMVGSNDAAPLSTSYGYSAVDQEFTRANMPTFWQAFEEGPTQSEDRLIAQGTLVGAGAVPPDRFVVGPYDRLSEVGWEYSVRGNSYGDSAVGMWWNPLSLAPGASRTVSTFYGLGQGAVSAGTLALNVSAPVELTSIGGLLSPNPFEVNVLVSNTGDIGVDGVEVEIDLPAGLSLMSGETARKSLNPGRLDADQTGQASWKVRAVATTEPTELSYPVNVTSTSSSVEGNQLTRTISIPAAAPSLYIAAAEAFSGDDPGEGQGWAMSPVDGAYDSATEVAELTLDVSDWEPGTHSISVRGRSSDGLWGMTRLVTLDVTGDTGGGEEPPEPVGDGVLTVAPLSPTTADTVILTISGDFPAANAAVQSRSFSIDNDLITFAISTEWTADAGATVITPWSVEETIGALDAGDYQIEVEVNGKPFLSSSLTVTEPVATEESPISIDFDMADGNQGQTTAGSATAGATYQLQLHVGDAPEISGWSATIEFDPAQVKYSTGSFQASSFISGLLALVDEKEGRVGVGGTVLGSNATGSGDGLLGSLTFEILDGFADSTRLVVTEMSFKRTDGQEDKRTVGFIATLTSEVTEQPLAGDFDGNDRVDFSDFFLFADQFGKEVPVGSPYDLSPDGKVDFSDFFVFADQFGESRGKLIALARELLGLPMAPELRPNYPNPFNSSTLIPYQLGEQADVRLDLFNLLGQRLRSLVDQRQQPGLYRVTWDGRDEQGRSLTSGLYIYRLQAGGRVEQRSMMLLR